MRKAARTAKNRKSISHSPSVLLTLGCLSMMAGATPVIAQTASEPTRLGGISVEDKTAQETYATKQVRSPKSTATLLNTPQSVTVITQDVIRERGATNLTDVLRNTPGISFNAGENGFATSSNNFSMRGFDSSGSIFIDNARDSGSYTRDVFNVESVEVVKGAAADNGRGSAGGYVNLNSKQPQLTNFINANINFGFDEYGSRARKRGTVDVNQEIADGIAIRLNAVLEDSGIAGRKLAKNSVWGIAPSIAFGLDSDLRAIISYEHTERDDRPDWGIPGAASQGLVTYNLLTTGAKRNAFYGLATDFDDATSDVILARLEYDLSSDISLSNQLRWNRVDRDSRFTLPTGFTAPATVTTSTNFYARKNNSLSNLTNLSAQFDTGSISHNLAAGVELTWEDSDADRLGGAVPASGSTDLFNPNPYRVGAAPFVVSQVASISVKTIAFYVYDTLNISDAFQITGGLRGEHYDVKINSLTAAGAPVGIADNFKEDKFSVSGKIGAVYKPTEDGSVYVSFGTSTLPPGSYLANSDISRTGDNAFPGLVSGAKPVRSDNYEIGVKWDFLDGGLSATAALFRTEKRNVAVVGREGLETVDTLKGYHSQISEGVELGVAGALSEDWKIFGGVLIMDSRRKISQYLDDVRKAGASGAGDYGAATSTNGDRLAFTPNFSANLWTTYRLPFGLTVGGGLQHVGSSYLGRPDDASRLIPNGRYGKLPDYTLVNAMLAYELTDNIDLRLNIDNLGDKKYAISSNWNGSRATLGGSRAYLISADIRF